MKGKKAPLCKQEVSEILIPLEGNPFHLMFSSRTTCAWNQWNHRTLSCHDYARPTWKREGRVKNQYETSRTHEKFQRVSFHKSHRLNVILAVGISTDRKHSIRHDKRRLQCCSRRRFSSDEFTHEIKVNRLNSSLSGVFLPAWTVDKCGDDKINFKLDSWIFRIEILLHCDLFLFRRQAMIRYWGFIERDQKLK